MAQGSQPGPDVQVVQSAQPSTRKDAVLVFGASGRLGRDVVTEVAPFASHMTFLMLPES